DGIRYFHVTGVQTCALPICKLHCNVIGDDVNDTVAINVFDNIFAELDDAGSINLEIVTVDNNCRNRRWRYSDGSSENQLDCKHRSEERRVGREWRSRR